MVSRQWNTTQYESHTMDFTKTTSSRLEYFENGDVNQKRQINYQMEHISPPHPRY